MPRDVEGGGAKFSPKLIGASDSGETDGTGKLVGGFGSRRMDDGTPAPPLTDGAAVLGGVAGAGGSSFIVIVGSGAAVLAGAAGAAARASRGRRGIPELPQSTCHSR